MEEFRTVYPEYNDPKQVVTWRKEFPHSIMLSDELLYQDGLLPCLKEDTIDFTMWERFHMYTING